jgi:16S rRNA (guanine966-N2)-methyltransferase
MRIIAGTYRGRNLSTVAGKDIRPTASRTREALFNILMHRYNDAGMPLLQEARIADVCCGSGAVGFEALSRGANVAHFYDNHNASLRVARENAASLGVTAACQFITCNAAELPKVSAAYDIIFTDPPYYSDLCDVIAQQITQKNWLHEHTLFITEQHKTEAPLDAQHGTLEEERVYGAAIIRIYTGLI